MEFIKGEIIDITESGLIIAANYQNIDRAVLRRYREVQVGLPDGRTISPIQRKKAWALIGEVAAWQHGYKTKITLEDTSFDLKREFVMRAESGFLLPNFSLSDCDMTTAREFISFLIAFVLEYGVPTNIPLYELCEDIQQYVYACLIHKKCAVCGRENADLHHYNAIGMGGDRTSIYQIGMLVVPLCREHHTMAHNKGKAWLTQDMHLMPIALTKEIGKKYGLTKKNLEA